MDERPKSFDSPNPEGFEDQISPRCRVAAPKDPERSDSGRKSEDFPSHLVFHFGQAAFEFLFGLIQSSQQDAIPPRRMRLVCRSRYRGLTHARLASIAQGAATPR